MPNADVYICENVYAKRAFLSHLLPAFIFFIRYALALGRFFASEKRYATFSAYDEEASALFTSTTSVVRWKQKKESNERRNLCRNEKKQTRKKNVNKRFIEAIIVY